MELSWFNVNFIEVKSQCYSDASRGTIKDTYVIKALLGWMSHLTGPKWTPELERSLWSLFDFSKPLMTSPSSKLQSHSWCRTVFFFFQLKYSWFTMIQVYSKVIQLYIHIYIYFRFLKILKDIEYSSLCYTVDPSCLFYI